MTELEDIRSSATGQKQKSLNFERESLKSFSKQNLEEREKKQTNLKNLVKEIYENENYHQDDKDIDVQPSFSKFEVPYFIKCRNRYNAKNKLYEQRFQYEIEQLIAQQATGYEATRLNRHLCITTFWPPLHSQSEIIHTQRYFFSLTPKERKRLNWIMNTNII